LKCPTENGKLRQNTRTSDLIFKSDFLVSFISRIMTLLHGDVISTGTPPGMGQIKPGDVIIEIERIGVLTNTVTAMEEVDAGSVQPCTLTKP
jgi:2-keto-4-pentenoate hydratase/2-oxohepta-3-ene-1,7-dioic acid hydratase in catechol pathway